MEAVGSAHLGLSNFGSGNKMDERRGPRRFLSLKDRLALYADEMRKKAAHLPPGIEKELLLKKADQASSAAEMRDEADRPRQQARHIPKT